MRNPDPSSGIACAQASFLQRFQTDTAGRFGGPRGEQRQTARGLVEADGLGQGEGLWIIPCEGIHTFFMRFPIDVVFLGKNKRVTKVVSRLKSSRLSISWRAHSVVELPVGVIEQTRTEVGDLIEVRERDG